MTPIPWPWGAAAGVAIGVAAAGGGPGVAAAVAAIGLLAVLRTLVAGGGMRLAWLAFGIGALLGAWRAHAWAVAPDPWAGRAGEEVVVEARVIDGVAWPLAGGAPGLLLRGAAVADGPQRLAGRLAEIPGRRNPGGFDAAAFHARRGVTAALVVGDAVALAPPGGRLRARAALRAGVVAGLPPPSAALMQALTLGLRDDLGPLREAFAASGLAHVLALSGLHVGLLAAVLTWAVGGVGRLRSTAVVALLLGYVAVVGPSPAVVRATAMVTAALLGRAFGVGGAGWASHLSLAAAASLLARPGWLGDLGFQLSYLSVLGMGLAAAPLGDRIAVLAEGLAAAARRVARARGQGAPRLAAVGRRGRGGRRSRFGPWLRGAAAVGVTAQWATGSLVASNFGAVPLVAPLANLVAVPLASLLVPLGFLAGLAGLLHEGAAELVNRLTGPVAAALLRLAELASRAPALPWGEVSPVGHAAFAVGSLALVAGLRGAWRGWRALTVAWAAGMVTVVVPPAWGTPDLIALDVGQGDAVVIRLARGQAVLVDGGGTPFSDFDVGARTVVPALRALGIGALPLVVASHADADHIEGLTAVLRSFPVGALLIGHPAEERVAFVDLLRTAAERGVPVVQARRGETYRVGGLDLDVLHPTHAAAGEPNEDSVGLLVRWRGAPWALLLGDAPAAVEARLAVPPTPLLLAPHHGSASSTSEALLRAAQPSWAWVSVGENRYGHPAASVLERLAAHGVAVRTTRAEGALRATFPLPPAPVVGR
ncbi:MAG: ComEC/Rec2 family competence protein [Trueperaceae bacterium]